MQKMGRVILCLLLIGTLVFDFNYSNSVYAQKTDESYVYLSDLWNTNHLLEKKSGWNDARALKVNENEPGKLISLLVGGEQVYFLNGIFAHATSTVIFDISEYTQKGFDIFSTYLGVDTYASSNGNGVKFTISLSKDNETWDVKETTDVMRGITEAKQVSINIEGYNYIKLYATDLGSNSSDHSVYADPIIYDSKKYEPREKEVDFIKTLSEYDTELKKHTSDEIISQDNLELMLLQRTLVSRVGYQILQAYTASSEESEETIKWLFQNKDVLKEYIMGGEPLGNYINSFKVLSRLYHTYSSDLSGDHKETFLKMMLAISLTHSSNVAFWVSGQHNELVLSDPVARYKVIKQLYTKTGLPDDYQPDFDTEKFESLTVEEMRWVVDSRLSDEEMPWLNWYSSRIQKEKTKYDGRNSDHTAMNPYTYIQYADGWNYYDTGYYQNNSMYCGTNYLNKNQNGFKRGLSCNEEYQLEKWGVGTTSTAKPRLWIIWEEDGVCGSLSKTGENLNGVRGIPAAVTRQPGHAAYLYMTKTKNDDGTYTTRWDIGNNVSGWGQSSGTEKGERLLLNWGTTTNSYASHFNSSYVLLAQRAIDDFKTYEKSLEYSLIADVYETDLTKQRELYRTIVGTQDQSEINRATLSKKNTGGLQTFNLDGWYGLIQTYLNDESKTSDDYYKLSYEIIANLKEFPLPMYDMLRLIEPKLEDTDVMMVDLNLSNTLTELANLKNSGYLQEGAVKEVAKYLLGQQDKPVTFSFSGENKNKIMLSSSQPFEYSLDYSYNVESGEVSATWTKVTASDSVDISDRLSEINETNDIVVHILSDLDQTPTSNSVTIIDVQKGNSPTGLYANELENKIMGWTDTMEWKILGAEESDWTSFTEQLPDLSGLVDVSVREGAHDNYLPSKEVNFTFEVDPEENVEKSYITVDRLKATASSRQKAAEHESKAIDGNANTYWHNLWDHSDTAKWIQLEVVDGPVKLSKIEYMPRQDNGVNGIFKKVKVEVSLTGEEDDWTVVDDDIVWPSDKNTKTYDLETPVLAKYVKLTALESEGNFASASMINLFEDKTIDPISVNDLTVDFTDTFVYDGTSKTPVVTVFDGDKELVLGQDYTIEYRNNVNIGTASIILKGLGIYEGEKVFEFSIVEPITEDNESVDSTIEQTESSNSKTSKSFEAANSSSEEENEIVEDNTTLNESTKQDEDKIQEDSSVDETPKTDTPSNEENTTSNDTSKGNDHSTDNEEGNNIWLIVLGTVAVLGGVCLVAVMIKKR